VEANDARSPWPRATRSRLRAIDPDMAAILESLFARDLVDDRGAVAPMKRTPSADRAKPNQRHFTYTLAPESTQRA
jgi:hypothetical protein